MAKTKRRRLLICGVCFRESCPLSRWIDDDGDDDDGLSNVLHDLQALQIDNLHSDLETEKASRLTNAEKQEMLELVQSEVEEDYGVPVQVETNINAFLETDVKTESNTAPIVDDGFLQGILDKASANIEINPDSLKQKHN